MCMCVCHILSLCTRPCFWTLFCFSPGRPFSLLMPNSGSPSATCKRTRAACYSSNVTRKPLASTVLRILVGNRIQRQKVTWQWSPLCVCLCEFGSELRAFISLVFVSIKKATWGAFYIVLWVKTYVSLVSNTFRLNNGTIFLLNFRQNFFLLFPFIKIL